MSHGLPANQAADVCHAGAGRLTSYMTQALDALNGTQERVVERDAEISRLKQREAQLIAACNAELERRRAAEIELELCKLDVQYWRKNYLEARNEAGDYDDPRLNW